MIERCDMSDIFERLKLIQPHIAKSQADFASILGIDEKTFGGQIRRKSSNIYPLLPKLFELIPYLSAEWLYLGKGEIKKGEVSGDYGALQQQIQELTEAHRRLAETNQRLVEELLKSRS